MDFVDQKHGGIPHGYFIPGTAENNLPSAVLSFPGLGVEGPPNIAVALFSFPYDQYRLAVSDDEACRAATAKFNVTKCFSSYERTFLVPMFE